MWRAESSSKGRTIQIVVTSRDGHTLVRLEENLTQLASGLFAGTTIGFGVGTGVGIGLPIGLNVLGSKLLAFAAPVGMIGISYVASRAIYRAIVRHRRRAIDELFSRTVAEVEASIASGSAARLDRAPSRSAARELTHPRQPAVLLPRRAGSRRRRTLQPTQPT